MNIQDHYVTENIVGVSFWGRLRYCWLILIGKVFMVAYWVDVYKKDLNAKNSN